MKKPENTESHYLFLHSN